MIKAHAVRVLAVALVLAGLAALVYFTVVFTWPDLIGAFPALNAGVATPLLAGLGAVVMALGLAIAVRQTGFIRAEKLRRDDRLRRVRVYQGDATLQPGHDHRVEPYIGPGTAAERQPDRRVA